MTEPPALAASMRPRVFPAEDPRPHPPAEWTVPTRFNEAAGIPRGRQSAEGRAWDAYMLQ